MLHQIAALAPLIVNKNIRSPLPLVRARLDCRAGVHVGPLACFWAEMGSGWMSERGTWRYMVRCFGGGSGVVRCGVMWCGVAV